MTSASIRWRMRNPWKIKKGDDIRSTRKQNRKLQPKMCAEKKSCWGGGREWSGVCFELQIRAEKNSHKWRHLQQSLDLNHSILDPWAPQSVTNLPAFLVFLSANILYYQGYIKSLVTPNSCFQTWNLPHRTKGTGEEGLSSQVCLSSVTEEKLVLETSACTTP